MENNLSKNKPLGTSSVAYANPVLIMGSGNIVGQMENEGPLAGSFDKVSDDKNDMFGEDTWEKAESALQKQAVALTLQKTCAQANQGLQHSAVRVIRSLFNMRRVADAWQHEYCGRLCRQSNRTHLKSFCKRTKGVPFSAGIRKPAPALCFMDGDRKRGIFITGSERKRKVGKRQTD